MKPPVAGSEGVVIVVTEALPPKEKAPPPPLEDVPPPGNTNPEEPIAPFGCSLEEVVLL